MTEPSSSCWPLMSLSWHLVPRQLLLQAGVAHQRQRLALGEHAIRSRHGFDRVPKRDRQGRPGQRGVRAIKVARLRGQHGGGIGFLVLVRDQGSVMAAEGQREQAPERHLAQGGILARGQVLRGPLRDERIQGREQANKAWRAANQPSSAGSSGSKASSIPAPGSGARQRTWRSSQDKGAAARHRRRCSSAGAAAAATARPARPGSGRRYRSAHRRSGDGRAACRGCRAVRGSDSCSTHAARPACRQASAWQPWSEAPASRRCTPISLPAVS